MSVSAMNGIVHTHALFVNVSLLDHYTWKVHLFERVGTRQTQVFGVRGRGTTTSAGLHDSATRRRRDGETERRRCIDRI
jgi:hypothetical protein